MKKPTFIAIALLTTIANAALATNTQIQIQNLTDHTIYLHKGGYAPAQKLAPNAHIILDYPFTVVPPNSQDKIRTSILIASAGGRWITTPNGYTALQKPTLCIQQDYIATPPQNTHNPIQWLIKPNSANTPGCQVSGYRQIWWQPESFAPKHL